MRKFDIRKTFELFWTEPLSILTEGLFQLVNIESNIFSRKSSVGVDIVDRKTQITVINSQKMYKLFQTMLHKRKFSEERKALSLHK